MQHFIYINSSISVHHHGLDGPLGVSDVAWTSELVTAFIEAGRLLGYDIGDLNGQLNSGKLQGKILVYKIVCSLTLFKILIYTFS